MGTYIPLTAEEKERAASVDLAEFLRQRGENLLPSGREKRLASDRSITIRGSEWYDHEEHEGGNAISFVRKHYGLSYPEAVEELLGHRSGQTYPVAQSTKTPPKPFELPQANRDMRRVFAYLVKHRHIDRSVVTHFARARLLYEDAKYHNCVFVGRDEQGIPRHAHKRSCNSFGKAFRQNVEGSDPKYSFHHMGIDGRLFVFEAPIDLLSYLTLYPEDWQAHSYVACCGTSAIPVLSMLERMSAPEEVYLCLDNDQAGETGSLRMAEQIAEQFNIASDRLLPEHKDWNDDLCAGNQEQETMTMGGPG
ncbi:DUF3991 domain-containing protein [Lawsonibacter sp. LCP25S3_G6]|uniref:DUF3991 domain-containing protein n=1 Tax=unclassified Lawsonibacter TaxID=2617946 RepID=UPI003F9589C6